MRRPNAGRTRKTRGKRSRTGTVRARASARRRRAVRCSAARRSERVDDRCAVPLGCEEGVAERGQLGQRAAEVVERVAEAATERARASDITRAAPRASGAPTAPRRRQRGTVCTLHQRRRRADPRSPASHGRRRRSSHDGAADHRARRARDRTRRAGAEPSPTSSARYASVAAGSRAPASAAWCGPAPGFVGRGPRSGARARGPTPMPRAVGTIMRSLRARGCDASTALRAPRTPAPGRGRRVPCRSTAGRRPTTDRRPH